MKTFCLLILFFFSNIGLASAQHEPTKRYFETFVSRAQVEKSLGKKIATQIPNYFNFKTHGLVWIPKKNTTKNPKVVLIEPNNENSSFPFTAISDIKFTLYKSKTIFRIFSDGDSCMGPAFPPRDEADEKKRAKKSAACDIAQKNRQKEINGLLYLFALPKKRLKTLQGTHQWMEPRP